MPEDKNNINWTRKWYNIIFKADTLRGRIFDEILLVLIILSIGVVILESIDGVRSQYGELLYYTEISLTFLFTIEYITRIIVSPKPLSYIFSFLGIIDLLAVLPTYLAILVPGAQSFLIIRAIRLLRIYRILKLYRYIRAENQLIIALRSSFQKIFIFMLFVFIMVILLGSLMYVVEKGENGFYNIPLCIYWAIITITTVGYGDIVPVTDAGRFIASFIMLLGYSIIAIPTGIVSAQLVRSSDRDKKIEKLCPGCQEAYHDTNAEFCKRCGTKL